MMSSNTTLGKRDELERLLPISIAGHEPIAQTLARALTPFRMAGGRCAVFAVAAALLFAVRLAAGQTTGVHWFVDCSRAAAGDGSNSAPWNSLAAAQAHPFAAGDRIALARGTVCNGSFSPQG